jgi:protein phosphatase
MTQNAGEPRSDTRRALTLAMESVAGRRPYQEDGVLAETLPDGRTLVAVADGMGGHAAGEVASAGALETLLAGMRDGNTLEEAFHLANGRVHAEARDPGKQGMGTTLVAMLLDGDTFLLANVGDSRAYLLASDGARQLTEDHSFVAEAVRNGEPEEVAMASRWRDALTRAVGTTPEIQVDLFGPFPVQDDSALLLCSDGLYKTLNGEDIHQIILDSTGPQDACRSLVAEAYDRGSDDNITVAMAYFGVGRKKLEPDRETPVEKPHNPQPAEPVSRDQPAQPDPGKPVFPVRKEKQRKRGGWWPFR